MLYVLCYPALAAADSERIETFRHVYEPARASLVRAHITLVFGVRSISINDLISRTIALAEKTAPFDVTFERAEVYEDHARADHKLFLMVQQGGESLTSLHRQLYAGSLSSELRDDVPFSPHMTVATASSLDLIHAARIEVRSLGLPISGRIEALHVAALDKGCLNHVTCLALGETRHKS